MAKLVTIERATKDRLEENVLLHNGDLIIVGDSMPPLMVIPYRGENNKDNCSLLNLQTGGLAFSEPCSRRTTRARITSHLANMYGSRELKSFPAEYRRLLAINFSQLLSADYDLTVHVKEKFRFFDKDDEEEDDWE